MSEQDKPVAWIDSNGYPHHVGAVQTATEVRQYGKWTPLYARPAPPAPELMSGNIYAERDHMAQGQHYLRHIDRMTAEGLHSKSAIAAELAHRDIKIEALISDLWAYMDAANAEATPAVAELPALPEPDGEWAWEPCEDWVDEPLSEGALMGVYMQFDRRADKKWTGPEYLLHFAAEVQRAAIAADRAASSTTESPEDQAEAFIQAAISIAPEPLRNLGEFLARVLDEDRWATAERLLLAIAVDRAARPVLTDEHIKALFDETKWPSEQFTIRVLSFARAVLAATQGSKP